MNKEEFTKIVNSNIVRDGIHDLMVWLDTTDFYTAPASTRFHECYEEGLVEHSLRVYRQLATINDVMLHGKYSNETIAIVGLFHDLCKIGCYKVDMRWRKDSFNRWEQYPTYKFDEDFVFGGHGSKSVYLLQNFIKLTPDEAVAINCHMGVENGKWEVNNAFRACPLAFITHVADMASTIDFNK